MSLQFRDKSETDSSRFLCCLVHGNQEDAQLTDALDQFNRLARFVDPTIMCGPQ